MNSIQKGIKYFAIGLAILLSLGIVGGVATIGYGIYYMVDQKLSNKENIAYNYSASPDIEISDEFEFSVDTFSELDTYFMENASKGSGLINSYQTYDDITEIFINISVGNVTIQSGSEFTLKAENVSEDFFTTADSGVLIIDASSSEFFNNFKMADAKTNLTITLPENFCADFIDIESGSGTILIDNIQTDTLNLSLGACKTNLSHVYAENVYIEGGVGISDFKDCTFTDADITCGVGKISFDGTLYGNCSISGGVGTSDFNLKNSYEDFMINISSGIGNIKVNGKSYHSSTFLNDDADNYLDISSGVGSISVKFAD